MKGFAAKNSDFKLIAFGQQRSFSTFASFEVRAL